MNKISNPLRIVIFIEGSFIPVSDGYSLTMSNLCTLLEKNHNIDLTIVHCDRSWSNKTVIKEKFKNVIIVSPEEYYKKPKTIEEKILKTTKKPPEIIQMQDAELIFSTGFYLRNIFQAKLIFHPHYIAANLAKKISLTPNNISIAKQKEILAAKLSDYTMCLAEHDKDYFLHNGVDNENISTILPSIFTKVPKLSEKHSLNQSVLFMGNLLFQPNREALQTLLYSTEKAPFSESISAIHIIGQIDIDFQETLSSKYRNATFYGRVDSIESILKNSHIAIFPIKEASGIRTKVLTCFALGIPVVGFAETFAGIPLSAKLKTACLSKDEKELQKKSLQLLNDRKLCLSIREQQYLLFQKYYSPQKIEKRILTIYSSTSNKYTHQEKLITKNIKLPFSFPVWFQEFKKRGK